MLAEGIYTLPNALTWGNFRAHLQAARKSTGLGCFRHACIATLELFPIISQIVSLCEYILIKGIYKKCVSLLGRVSKNDLESQKKVQLLYASIDELLKEKHTNEQAFTKNEELFDALKAICSNPSFQTLEADKQVALVLFAARYTIENNDTEYMAKLLTLKPRLDTCTIGNQATDLIVASILAHYWENRSKVNIARFLENQQFTYKNKSTTIQELKKTFMIDETAKSLNLKTQEGKYVSSLYDELLKSLDEHWG